MLSPRMIVVCPTSTPATSVIALSGPGSSTPTCTPISRARGRISVCATPAAPAFSSVMTTRIDCARMKIFVSLTLPNALIPAAFLVLHCVVERPRPAALPKVREYDYARNRGVSAPKRSKCVSLNRHHSEKDRHICPPEDHHVFYLREQERTAGRD